MLLVKVFLMRKKTSASYFVVNRGCLFTVTDMWDLCFALLYFYFYCGGEAVLYQICCLFFGSSGVKIGRLKICHRKFKNFEDSRFEEFDKNQSDIKKKKQ